MTHDLSAATAAVQRTIAILRQNSCEAWAGELERSLADLSSSNRITQKEALVRIGDLCHPKALGDAHVSSMNRRAWSEHLEGLHDLCARAFNVLERAPA